MYTISKENFCNLADENIIHKSIKSSINLLLENKQSIALLMFSVCCIDSFSNRKFIEYVKKYFKQYFENDLLSAEDFYKQYRCKMVHNYSIGKGYLIANDYEINGKYVSEIECDGNKFIALNIDKFIDDFNKHLKEKFNLKDN